MSVEEGGVDMSHGQRQLLCIARAMLHRRPISVIDEATASVDYETDQAIQKVLRDASAFSGWWCREYTAATPYDSLLLWACLAHV